MKYIKSALPFILGIPAGYILTLKVFSEIIPVLFGTMGIVYSLVLYSTLICIGRYVFRKIPLRSKKL